MAAGTREALPRPAALRNGVSERPRKSGRAGLSSGAAVLPLAACGRHNSRPANYWIGLLTGGTTNTIGYRYDKVTSSRDSNSNSSPTGPSNPFGAVSVDGEQMSLHATYTPALYVAARDVYAGLGLAPPRQPAPVRSAGSPAARSCLRS
jgi:hypothetical protein